LLRGSPGPVWVHVATLSAPSQERDRRVLAMTTIDAGGRNAQRAEPGTRRVSKKYGGVATLSASSRGRDVTVRHSVQVA
jgi:hypothetical protein